MVDGTSPAASAARGRLRLPDGAAGFLGLSAVLCAQAVVFAQVVTAGAASDYDEGTYLASVDALRHGQRLGSDVFASQPPGWYHLLELLSFVSGRSVELWRVWMVALALAGTVAVYLLARRLAGTAAGLLAAALVGIAPFYADFAARIVADVPALAFACAALAVAVAAFERRNAGSAVAAGVLFALAVSIKLTAVTALAPLLGLAVALRAARREAGAVSAGVLVTWLVLALVHVSALGSLWNGAVTYHRLATHAAGVPNAGANRYVLRQVYVHGGRTLFVWLALAGAVAFVLLLARRRGGRLWPLWLWPIVAAGVLIETRPLHENHYTLLSLSLGLAAGASLGAAVDEVKEARLRTVLAATVAVMLAVGYVRQGQRLHRDVKNERDGPEVAYAVDRLRESRGLVATDRPIAAYLADRRMPGDLVDTAVLRFATASLTDAEVLRAVDRDRVTTVAVGRAFRDRPAIQRGLRRRFADVQQRFGVTVYSHRR
jgi:4-amino-4-deoxy-L-arabinose transferase-like glycosyltransferase